MYCETAHFKKEYIKEKLSQNDSKFNYIWDIHYGIHTMEIESL